jgi:hypothetical protein
MDIDTLFVSLPLSVVFALTVGLVLLSMWLGFRIGHHRRRRPAHELEESVGPVVGALLALVAFLLTFTFGMAANRYDTRKQLVLDEVNAIGTAYLRARLLPLPQAPEIQRLLREYVDIRATVPRNPDRLAQAITRSDDLLDKLWDQLIPLANENRITRGTSLFIESLNDVIDFQTKRVTVGLQYRIPGPIWFVLYVLSVIAVMSVGYQFGLSGKDSRLVSVLLSLALSMVILLIADLDRSGEGVLVVNQKPMIELQQKLHRE